MADNDLDADLDTDTDTGGKGDSTTPEQQAAIRVIGREMWRNDSKSEGKSDASVEDRKASWTENRRKYLSAAKRMVKALEKQGVQLTVSPDASAGKGKKKKADKTA